MFRKAIFWIHLSCGVAAGLVVLMMSVTGVILTYERQILAWQDRGAYAYDPIPEDDPDYVRPTRELQNALKRKKKAEDEAS